MLIPSLGEISQTRPSNMYKVSQITWLAFFFVRERAVFYKSCDLIGSGSGRYSPIRPAHSGRYPLRDESSSVLSARNHFAALYERTHERFALQNRSSRSPTVVNVKRQNRSGIKGLEVLLKASIYSSTKSSSSFIVCCLCISQSYARHYDKLRQF